MVGRVQRFETIAGPGDALSLTLLPHHLHVLLAHFRRHAFHLLVHHGLALLRGGIMHLAVHCAHRVLVHLPRHHGTTRPRATHHSTTHRPATRWRRAGHCATRPLVSMMHDIVRATLGRRTGAKCHCRDKRGQNAGKCFGSEKHDGTPFGLVPRASGTLGREDGPTQSWTFQRRRYAPMVIRNPSCVHTCSIHPSMFFAFFARALLVPQAQRIGNHRNRTQAHGQCGNDWRKQLAGEWIEQSSSQRDAERVVHERKGQVLAHVAHGSYR